MSAIEPYLVLVLVGFLPNEMWRMLGLVLGRGLDENSQIVLWARGVSTAILAGVIAKLVLFAGGALSDIPLYLRVGAVAGGLIGFLAIRRSVLAGIVAGETILIAGAALLTR